MTEPRPDLAGEAWQDGRGFAVMVPVLLVLLALITQGAVLGFGLSPEDWAGLGLLRERSLPEAMAPLGEYPYWRPLWYAWLWVVEHAGLSGGPAHLAPLLAHALALPALVRLARSVGVPRAAGLQIAALACVMPGTVPALAWLAAGNKAFVLCALLWGAVWLREARGKVGLVRALVPALLLPLGCSENAYAMLLLYPLVLLLPPRRLRLSVVALVALAALAACLLHLSSLPAPAAGTVSRPQELFAAFRAAPLGSAWSVCENLGRFFVYGISGLEDRPGLGLAMLGLCTVQAVAGLKLGAGRDRDLCRGVGLALLLFLVLQVPASLFPGEASRHHAYLPAIGAGCVLAALGAGLPRRLRLWGFFGLLVLLQLVGARERAPWRRYLDHSERVWTSSLEVLPEFPEGRPVVLLNVPWEYRAAFTRRFGHVAEIAAWSDLCLMTTRASWLAPLGVPLPETQEGIWIEYDGRVLRRMALGELAARPQAPRIWSLPRLRPFPDPVARWGQVLGSDRPLESLPWSMTLDRPTEAGLPNWPVIRLLDEHNGDRSRGVVHSWDLEVPEHGIPGWVVLGWSPLGMRTTENVGLFQLTPIPWMFRVEVYDIDSDVRIEDVACVPILGLLPALHVPASNVTRRWRAELHLR